MTAAERTLTLCDTREQRNRAKPFVKATGPTMRRHRGLYDHPTIVHFTVDGQRSLCGVEVADFDRSDAKRSGDVCRKCHVEASRIRAVEA